MIRESLSAPPVTPTPDRLARQRGVQSSLPRDLRPRVRRRPQARGLQVVPAWHELSGGPECLAGGQFPGADRAVRELGLGRLCYPSHSLDRGRGSDWLHRNRRGLRGRDES